MTQISYVVDAGVGVKLFLKENYTAEVQTLFRTIPSLAVPDMFYMEIANVLWHKIQRGLYTQRDALDNLNDLTAMALITTPSIELMSRALEIGCRYKIAAYDACYVTLAERYDAPLLAEDEKLVQRMRGSPIRVMTIGDYLLYP